MLFTTLVVAVTVRWLVPELPWAACFALGAIVSPPDAVAARAVLQRVTLPRRLQALLEGESLLNDATGLVLFRFAVAATLSGAFDAGEAVGSFLLVAIGGAAVGIAVAAAWIAVMRRMTDETLVVATATLLCWAAYLGGEALHVSGVIATVAAGIVFGWYQHVVLPAKIRMQGSAFWRTLVFSLEALVFILIGFSLRGVLERVGGLEAVLTTMAAPVIGVVAAVLLARFAWVFGSDALLTLLRRAGLKRARPLGWRQAGVLGWAGMRGVVTLAVALALAGGDAGARPDAGRGLRGDPGHRDPAGVEPRPAHRDAEAGRTRIRPRRSTWPAPRPPWPGPRRRRWRSMPTVRTASSSIRSCSSNIATGPRPSSAMPATPPSFTPGIRAHFDAVLAAIAAARAELVRLHRQGLIEDEVLHDLERDLDLEELGALYQQGE